jgi:DNA-binding GntR family transcriptional regulator
MALVQSVLKEVLGGHWKPGQHLTGQQLADRYGVSQTPIREALITLAGIGVVDLLPNRGAVVRSMTAREVREVCQLRRVLECEAVRSACGRIDEHQLQAMIDETKSIMESPPEPETLARAIAVDEAFHDLIAKSCGNSLLGREIDRLQLLFRTYRETGWERASAKNDYPHIVDDCEQHLAIMESLLAKNASAAARAMAVHIRSSERYWCKILLPAPARRKRGST